MRKQIIIIANRNRRKSAALIRMTYVWKNFAFCGRVFNKIGPKMAYGITESSGRSATRKNKAFLLTRRLN